MSEKETGIFYLGEDYPGIYFTKREVECLVHILEGHTLVSAANLLGLSPRTVEFYVKNMRLKTGAYSKNDLVRRIRQTDFVKEMSSSSSRLKDEVLGVAEGDVS